MLQKPWFKVFIWFMATCFFFLMAGVLISIFKPGPSEVETMKFMAGMMSAMDKSMMGVAMNIEHDSTLQAIISFTSNMTLPIIFVGLGLGLGIRFLQRRVTDV